jgi:ketosteroid isomerase-like protein
VQHNVSSGGDARAIGGCVVSTVVGQVAQSEASRAVVLAMYHAIKIGDFAHAIGFISPDVVVHEPPFAPWASQPTYEGLDEFDELIPDVAKYLDFSTIDPGPIIAEGENVFAVLRMKEQDSDRKVVIAEYSVVREGQIVEIRVFCHEMQGLKLGI